MNSKLVSAFFFESVLLLESFPLRLKTENILFFCVLLSFYRKKFFVALSFGLSRL